ncbi:phospholipid scramblase 1 [Caerostris extrusa]|uniref:Phospholipid scramblase n=1 Tax=Caerostris extrusa TaxID=172846 RepID=A0AAV4RV31_CAEEX|nr:phospholipid scramblase 1 [Caerostris extrusa]
MSYPPNSPSAPPPGINPAILQGGGDYPQGGYPPPGYPPQSMDTYPPPGSYPQPAGYHPGTAPISQQPGPGAGYPPPGAMQPGADWMPMPTGIPVCPPGLEYLTMIDQLLVHQKVELLEAFISFETKNKYTIKNSLGQKIYTAKEDTDCCTRNCCGNLRPFDMKIKDNAGREVIHLYRELRCTSCCCPCCLQKLEVFAPAGTLIGTVIQEWSICTPLFRVENASGETVLKIEGPVCTCSICGDVDFEVLSTNGVKVGKISKQWSGLLREAFTDADHFGITFPMDLDVKMKATLLGALFLIDYMFFEKEGNKESDGVGMF